MAETKRAIAGARARLLVNGKEVGWATGVGCQETITVVAVDVLGNVDAEELEPVHRAVTFTADFVRIKKSDLMAMGLWPRGTTPQVVDFPPLTIEVYDGIADAPIYKVEGAKPQSRNWRVDRGGLMTINASFMALRLYDEIDA